MKRNTSKIRTGVMVFSVLAACSLGFGFLQHEGHASEPAAEHEKGGEKDLTLWKWANFALLAGGLGFLLVKKAGPFFNARTSEIRQGIDMAAKMKAEADARYQSMEQRLQHLDREIADLRQHAAQAAAAENQHLRQQTESDLQKIRAEAEREIEAAGKSARQQLRAYSAELAIDLAQRKIQERLTPELQDSLVRSTLGDLKRKAAVQS